MPHSEKSHKDPVATMANETLHEAKNELIIAIEKGDLKQITTLLRDANFFTQSYKDSEGNTPLHYVGKIKDEKLRGAIARALIFAGMDIDLCNDKDEKPQNHEDFEDILKERNGRFLTGFHNWMLIKPTFSGQRVKLLAELVLQICVAVFIPEFTLFFMALFLCRLFIGTLSEWRDNSILQKRHKMQVEADFCRAITDNKLNAVKLVQYIEQGVNIHQLGNINSQSSALAEAAYVNNFDQVKFLLPFSKPTDLADLINISDSIDTDILNYICSEISSNSLSYMFRLSMVANNLEMLKLCNLHAEGKKLSPVIRYLLNDIKNPTLKQYMIEALVNPDKNHEKENKVVTPFFEAKLSAKVANDGQLAEEGNILKKNITFAIKMK